MQWMTDGIREFTATGRQKKPSEELICSCISFISVYLFVWNSSRNDHCLFP